ncbi:MAG: MBL fold metallo-hydrolase [Nitrospira sp.]|nr:MBL fold metallo-hydrolase [Nitrospira sp.]MBH0180108.1 MBL fold metallo-hydrolase [Nitrospira sp.]MBH0185320.1 MBL fold metallo-hydrolase [Nitrospira sp.]
MTSVIVSLSLVGCVERIVEPADVFGNVERGETYSPASKMINDWYAVEAIDAQTFAINEPKSSQYNTSYLIVGDKRAIMFDAGSGERPPDSRSMHEVAEQYTDKPITLMLSHFHYDHIGDATTFDGVTLIDRPEIVDSIKNAVFMISPLESLDTEWHRLKVAAVIADGNVIDLGGRTLDVLNLPGHTTESVVLRDRDRNQIFTGDFVYRHLGGIIAFAPASDLSAYKTNSARLLQLTNVDTSFFGAHGIPQFGRDWLMLLDSELDKMVRGDAEYRYTAHYLAPGIPWRMHRNGEMYIYTTPLVNPPLFWSKWMLLVMSIISMLFFYLLYRIVHLPFATIWEKRT